MPRTNAPTRRARRPARPAPVAPPLADLRRRLGMTQAEFGRLLGFSTRWVAAHESKPPTGPAARRAAEVQRLLDALARSIRKNALGKWLTTPNPALDNFKPLELIERGQTDRLWRIAFHLEAGV